MKIFGYKFQQKHFVIGGIKINKVGKLIIQGEKNE